NSQHLASRPRARIENGSRTTMILADEDCAATCLFWVMPAGARTPDRTVVTNARRVRSSPALLQAVGRDLGAADGADRQEELPEAGLLVGPGGAGQRGEAEIGRSEGGVADLVGVEQRDEVTGSERQAAQELGGRGD